MYHDEHTCVFKQHPENIFIAAEYDALEMSYIGVFNNMPAYGDQKSLVLLYDDDSWQFVQKGENSTEPRSVELGDEVVIRIAQNNSDLLDINGYNDEDVNITLTFFDDVEMFENFLNSPYHINIIVHSTDGKPNNFLSGEYEYHKMMNNAQSFVKRSESDGIDILLWSTGDSWVFTEEKVFGMTNPINWLKLETLDRSIKYLKVDWLENSGDVSLVSIDFEPNFNSQLTDKIFLAIDDVYTHTGEKAHRIFDGEYKLAGRMNNAPYYKRIAEAQLAEIEASIAETQADMKAELAEIEAYIAETATENAENDAKIAEAEANIADLMDRLQAFKFKREQEDKVLMFKDSEWFLCQKFYGQYDCQINLKEKEYEEPDEIMTDISFNKLFHNTEWLLFSTDGDYIDDMTSFIDEIPTGFYQKRIKVEVWSSDDRWYWSGDDVRIVQQNKFGEYITSKTILPENAKYRSTYFDARPDDHFLIKNGGNDGVFIKQIKFDNTKIWIYLDGWHSSFWIDGNQQDCDGEPQISGLTIVNGEVIWTPCHYQ